LLVLPERRGPSGSSGRRAEDPARGPDLQLSM